MRWYSVQITFEIFSEELLWCPNLESDETEITNYLSKWQDKSEDSNIADNEEALTQLMKSNYNFEDALGKKSEKNEIPSIYHEKITEEQWTYPLFLKQNMFYQKREIQLEYLRIYKNRVDWYFDRFWADFFTQKWPNFG